MTAEPRHLDLESDLEKEIQALCLQEDAAWHDFCYGRCRYWERAYQLARIWGLSPQDAEDAAIDILFKVWRNLPKYDPVRARLVTWFYIIARSVMTDLVKSSDYRQHTCNCSIDALPPGLSSPSPNPEEAAISQNEQSNLTLLMSANGVLTRQDRLVLYYSFYEDLVPQEIAMVLTDKTPGQISGIRFRALNKLRNFLIGCGYRVIPKTAALPRHSRLILALPHGLVVQRQNKTVGDARPRAIELTAADYRKRRELQKGL